MAALTLELVDGELRITDAPDVMQSDFGLLVRAAAVGTLDIQDDTFTVVTKGRVIQYRLIGVRREGEWGPVRLLEFEKSYDGLTDPRETHADEYVPDVGIVRFEQGVNTGTLIDPMTELGPMGTAAMTEEAEAARIAAEVAVEQSGEQQ